MNASIRKSREFVWLSAFLMILGMLVILLKTHLLGSDCTEADVEVGRFNIAVEKIVIKLIGGGYFVLVRNTDSVAFSVYFVVFLLAR